MSSRFRMPCSLFLRWFVKRGRTQRVLRRIALCTFLFLLMLTALTMPVYPDGYQLPDDVIVDMDQYDRFEPPVFYDLNFNDDGKPKIQKIIHQTWKSRLIPSKFIKNIKTFVQHNPKWKYYLWTDKSARQLIVDFYPQLLNLWDGAMYSKYPIRRADVLRYVVLYHYGGVYADLDVMNYRPLDNATTKHPCVFSPEPYEHSILQLFTPYLLSNAVMLCSKGHPFLKHLIDNLHTSEFYKDTVDSTGPGFITTQFKIYSTLDKGPEVPEVPDTNRTRDALVSFDNGPHLFADTLHTLTNSSVYIANSQYFLPSMDDRLYPRLAETCNQFQTLPLLFKRMCVNAKFMGFTKRKNRFSFTEHLWYMTWFAGNNSWIYDAETALDIKELVPSFSAYEGRFGDLFIV